MTKTLALAEALERAADKVEAKPHLYNWYEITQCNCGLVAAELTGIHDRELIFRIDKEIGVTMNWSEISCRDAATCPLTKLPIDSVIYRLRAAGLSGDDFASLEQMSDENVLKRAGIITAAFPNGHYVFPSNFVKYARAMASMIREQLEINELAAKEIPAVAEKVRNG